LKWQIQSDESIDVAIIKECRRGGILDFLDLDTSYDTWLIDKIQNIVEQNHNKLAFPTWVNADNYAETEESFGVIPLQTDELSSAVNEQAANLDLKLTREQRYLAKQMGVTVPFTSVVNAEEVKFFKRLIVDDRYFMTDSTLNDMAFSWLQHMH